MASKKHQFILGLIIRKMREDGYIIKCVDGKYNTAFNSNIVIPPKIINHKPDAFGINQAGKIAIGEAKTKDDIQTLRTMTQLKDYANIMLNEDYCKIYIGIPECAKNKLDTLLIKIGLYDSTNIIVLNIPEEIIND